MPKRKTVQCVTSPKKKSAIARIINVRKRCKNKDAEEELLEKGQPFKVRGSKFKPTILFELLIAITVVVQIYLIMRYQDDPTTDIVQFNWLNIWFCVIGRYIYGIIGDVTTRADIFKTNKFNDYHTTDFWDIMLGFGLFLIILITQSLLRPVKLNVTALDAFLFYVFSATAEEAFFRFFLTAVPIIIGMRMMKIIDGKDTEDQIDAWKVVVLKLTVGIVTGLTFGLAHSQRYVGGDLLAIVANGLEFSLFYAFTKRIDIAVIGHLLLNMSFGVQLLLGN